MYVKKPKVRECLKWEIMEILSANHHSAEIDQISSTHLTIPASTP